MNIYLIECNPRLLPSIHFPLVELLRALEVVHLRLIFVIYRNPRFSSRSTTVIYCKDTLRLMAFNDSTTASDSCNLNTVIK